jgi:hypothetical protein
VGWQWKGVLEGGTSRGGLWQMEGVHNRCMGWTYAPPPSLAALPPKKSS